uniref:Nuclear Testis protein N-terminal domain-containing protein n=1 Tax=Rhinopithecus bieti TaxID=61621 RepID=A0A2K6M2L3_RHIBE
SGTSFCCESEGQLKSCLKGPTPSVLLPSSWKGNSGSCLLARALHRMSPTPAKPSCPPPLPLCRMSGVLSSVEPGHSLGPTLDFSHCGNCQTAVVSAQPEGMASNGAYPVLGTGVTVNPGASLSMFTALPLATPAPGASNTVLLYPMVLHGSYSAPTGQDASRPNVGACLQRLSKLEGTEVGAVNASQARPWPRSGRPSSGVQAPSAEVSWCRLPYLLAAAPVVAWRVRVHQHHLTALPRMPPPSCLQGNAGPRPQEDSLERSTPGLPPTAKSPPDNSCNPNEVSMENFRLWQHYSPLPEAPFSQSPDTEALSASFIPVLRSLARRKPTMTLEEGLWQAMWEWQRTSNFDRMIFYEMAEKFLEFEAEEEMQMQKAQWMKGTQSLPPPAPPRLEPQGPPAPEVVKQPGTASHIPTGATAKAKGATGGHCPHTQCFPSRGGFAPQQDTPGGWGQGPPRFLYLLWVSLAPGYSLPRKLMSSSFCFQVEAVIHSPFLEELLSPDPQMDLLALSQELEKEEELTLAQGAPSDAPGTDRC